MHPVSRVNSRNQYAPVFRVSTKVVVLGTNCKRGFVLFFAKPLHASMRRGPAHAGHMGVGESESLATRWGAMYLRPVRIFLLVLPLAILFPGCAFKPKSEARIYDGDAPTIRYAPSTAGGPQSVY